MAEHLRFHLDESIDPDIATALRRFGIDVTTTWAVGLSGKVIRYNENSPDAKGV